MSRVPRAPFFCLFPFCTDHHRLAPEAVGADTAGTRDGAACQSFPRADLQGGQRNLPETLFVLLEIKRSAGMMTGSAICDFSILTSYFPRVRSRTFSVNGFALFR